MIIAAVLFIALFICVSSIFFPELRRLAKAILSTFAVIGIGLWVLFEVFAK